jgi:NosR/NirI family transcriptional regulator, nitrous oxide reductase regulator
MTLLFSYYFWDRCLGWHLLKLLLLTVCLILPQRFAAAYGLTDFAPKFELQQIMPGATRLGPVEGSPPSAIAYKGDTPLGYVFLNSSAVSAIGYSGKPIHVVIGVSVRPERSCFV